MKPVLSIIVPIYNVEKYIERCIISILNQSFSDFELIMVNDCTLDNSMLTVEKYANMDNRIQIINKSQNEGLMAARQTGYINAKGDYVIFCDSDDYLPQDAVEILYKAIQNSTCQIVFGGCTYLYQNGIIKERHRSNVSTDTVNDVYRDLIQKKMKCYVFAAIYRRDIFNNFIETINNQTINEDFLLLIQLLQYVDRVKIIKKSVYFYCQNFDSICNEKWNEKKFTQEVFSNNWSLTYLLNKGIYAHWAKRLYLKRITYLLEVGYTRKKVFSSNETGQNLFTLNNLIKYCGIKYSIYAMLLYYSNPCRYFFRQGRRLFFSIVKR
jgi:glycosyltransferase involved in cell wall biosynthesis